MPPVSPQQSSRGGLIAAVVTFAVLFLVMSVLYFQQRGQTLAAEGNAAAIEARQKCMLPADLSSPGATAAKEAAEQAKYPGADTAFDVLTYQVGLLGAGITGQKNVPAETAEQFAKGALNESQSTLKAAGINPGDRNLVLSQNDGLVPAIRKLTGGVVALANDKKAADAATAAARAENKALQDQLTQQAAAKDAEIKKAQEEAANRQKDVEGLQQKQAQAMTEVGTNTSAQLNQLNEQVKASESKVAELNGQIKKLQDEQAQARKRLAQYRLDPRDNMVRRPDGRITRVMENGTVLINLGRGNALPVGLTFAVYDASIGIPGLNADIAGLDDETAVRTRAANARLAAVGGAGAAGGGGATSAAPDRYENALPSGIKGSIEVTQIEQDVAVCRVIRTEPGQRLQPNDLVANLVYNQQIKPRLVVFGEFDLDYNNVTTAGDTARVRNLITQWGGIVVPAAAAADIGPDIDYIVLGIRPTVPTLSAEEGGDANMVQRVETAKAALQKYNDVLDRAAVYSIPVLNQTRFLYYTGFFDQRTR